MSKTMEYEEYKKYLQKLNLTPAEYQKKLRQWCIKNKYWGNLLIEQDFLKWHKKWQDIQTGAEI